ncbi:MAG: hypothetical protein PHQ17_02200 [Methanobacterium sp.]|jgi:hypothetical protein|nr:hypothetical protein [Methanobacterium sp.]
MEIWYIFVAVPIIGAILHFFIIKKELTKNRVLEVLLLWFLGFGIGVGSIFSGLAQIVSPEIVAQSVGWPNSPFLREVGFANISYGILGILSIKYRSFWAPTIIAYAVFMWGAAISHIHNIQQTGNLASGNAGTVLYLDILMPIIFILLLFTYNKTKVVIGN